MFYYATLTQVKALRDLSGTTDDALLMEFLYQATDWINTWKERRFDVHQETRYFDVPGDPTFKKFGYYPGIAQGAQSNQVLRMDGDLLSVVTLTNGDTTVIPAAGYWLEDRNLYPRHSIRLKSSYTWEADADGETHQVISVNGLWGYHDHYDKAWVDSGDELQAGISAAATSLTVADYTGAADDLLSPRFQVGQMICIDSEFMLITAITAGVGAAADTLTVQRAFNGTTAATHLINAPVYVFRLMGIVVRSTLRLVQWMYTQKDVDTFDRTYVLGAGVVNVPTALPTDVRAFLGAKKMR